jgi:hypothetical protein
VKTCAACGHELGLGRFCTNCGHPVDTAADGSSWRTDTAERRVPRDLRAGQGPPAPPPFVPGPARVPPAAVTPPPPPRYPLFADELQPAATRPSEPDEAVEQVAPIVTVDEQLGGEVDGPERRSRLSWVAAALALAVLAVGAYALWTYVLDDPDAPSGAQATDTSDQDPSDPKPVDVASLATADAPETAAPEEDVDGQLVSYDASNMLDGVPETAWRAPGDASGMRLTFTLARRTRLTEVGILNGYAKRSSGSGGEVFDWYRGNRRVEAVIWRFGKGTPVRQELRTDRALQTISIDPVTTRKVVVLLVQVSAPGTGRAGRDYTAVSEISLVGFSV